MAFRCLAHNKRNAKAKICIQIHPNQIVPYHTIPYRTEANQIELSWVELGEDCEFRTQIWRLCHILLCMTNIVCVCVCVLSNIVYMGLFGLWSLDSDSDSEIWILFARPLLRPLCPLVASQSIVQMSKLHLLCASQKLKQIILPIAFWFRMSVTVLLLGGYATEEAFEVQILTDCLRFGGVCWVYRSPTIYVNFCVFAASGVWNYAMPLLIYWRAK